MNIQRPGPERAPLSGARRIRDVVAMTGLACILFLILAASSALGWVEALTAMIVMATAAAAYFVGTSAAPENETADAVLLAQEAILTAESALPAVLDTLPLPALFIGQDGRVEATNEAARTLLRMRSDRRALAASVIRNPALLTSIEKTLEGKAAPERVELALGAGSEQLWLAHVAPFNLDPRGALVIMEDHTALRRAEKARADFLANASHELRTPLTSLAGFIETMRGPARNDPQSWPRYLDIMFAQTERMKRLIADLLSLSRIEFSEHRAPDRVEDLADIVAVSVATLRPLAEGGEVSLHLDGPGHGLNAVADADEVTQVAQNLITNAVKYSGSGAEVNVTIGWAPDMDAAQRRVSRQWPDAERMTILPAASAPGSGPAVWLRVSDTGPGIDREHLPRLGQRFYRVDESRGGEVSGTGLGLAIVKHIMARHRGGFAVESRPGEGAAFGVWFPALRQPVAALAVPGESDEIGPLQARSG